MLTKQKAGLLMLKNLFKVARALPEKRDRSLEAIDFQIPARVRELFSSLTVVASRAG